MARSGEFEQVVFLTDLVGTTDANNKLLWANNRSDGASLELISADLVGVFTASTTNYYTISLYKTAGSAACSRTTAAGNTITSQLSFGTVTAANARVNDGENLYATFAQTGNGMTMQGAGIRLSFKVLRAGS